MPYNSPCHFMLVEALPRAIFLGHKEYRLSLGRDSANECKTSLLMYCRLPLILSNDNADECNVSFLTDCRVQFF